MEGTKRSETGRRSSAPTRENDNTTNHAHPKFRNFSETIKSPEKAKAELNQHTPMKSGPKFPEERAVKVADPVKAGSEKEKENNEAWQASTSGYGTNTPKETGGLSYSHQRQTYAKYRPRVKGRKPEWYMVEYVYLVRDDDEIEALHRGGMEGFKVAATKHWPAMVPNIAGLSPPVEDISRKWLKSIGSACDNGTIDASLPSFNVSEGESTSDSRNRDANKLDETVKRDNEDIRDMFQRRQSNNSSAIEQMEDLSMLEIEGKPFPYSSSVKLDANYDGGIFQTSKKKGSDFENASAYSPLQTQSGIHKRNSSMDVFPRVPKRRRSTRSEVTSRLIKGTQGAVEYIKGKGMVRTEIDYFSEEDDDIFSVGADAEDRGLSSKDHSFELKMALTPSFELKTSPSSKLLLKWNSTDKMFELPRCTFPGKAIMQAKFCNKSEQMCFEVDPKNDNVKIKSVMVWLQENDGTTMTILKHVISSCLGTMMPVIAEDQTVLDEIASKMRKTHPRNGRSNRRPSNKSSSVRMSRASGAAVSKSYESSRIQNENDTKIKEEETQEERKRLSYECGESVEVNDLVVRMVSDVASRLGQLKLEAKNEFDGPWRVAEIPKTGALGTNKLLDLFSSDDEEEKNLENDEAGSSDPEESTQQSPGMCLQLSQDGHRQQVNDMPHQIASAKTAKVVVRLEFPKDSRANDWTELSRLFPVFKCSEENGLQNEASSAADIPTSISIDGRLLLNGPKEKLKWSEGLLNDDSEIRRAIWGYVCLKGHLPIPVEYSPVPKAPIGKDGLFAIENICAQRIRVLSGEEAKGLKTDMNDPEIVRHLQGLQIPPKANEVLVVEFLVHWEGWPKEDDTWEKPSLDLQIPVKEFRVRLEKFKLEKEASNSI